MRRSPPLLFKLSHPLHAHTRAATSEPPIIHISNATFYRHHPSSVPATADNAHHNPPLFPHTTFSLPSFSSSPQHWSIIGPSSSGKTTFLQILRGHHLALPPTARSHPYLASAALDAKDPRLRSPTHAIQHVGFDNERGGGAASFRGAYLSARYESRREETDFSLLAYLRGHTSLNPNPADEHERERTDAALLARVVADLRLEPLLHMPVGNLSNGQTRRARIARALLGRPEVLLLDEPFMGLDPPTLVGLAPLLGRLAEAGEPRLVLALRPQDGIPEWVTHLVWLEECRIVAIGRKGEVLREVREMRDRRDSEGGVKGLVVPTIAAAEIGRSVAGAGTVEPSPETVEGARPAAKEDHGEMKTLSLGMWGDTGTGARTSRDGFTVRNIKPVSDGEAMVEMEGVKVQYGDRIVLGDWTQDVDGQQREGLFWTVKQGQRWGIFGPNGSGKTTVLSLITSDHPQTYSQPIRLFQRSRLPSPGVPGLSLFDIQSRIGHSSPEIHAFFPRRLSVRRALESAWADAPLSKPRLTHDIDLKVDACLRWFQPDLNPALGPTPVQKHEIERDNDPSTPKPASTGASAKREAALAATLQDPDALDWADALTFGELPFSAQRVALLIRALIADPDLVILDEAFSGMDAALRDKCLLFLSHGESKRHGVVRQRRSVLKSDIALAKMVTFAGLKPTQALLVVSHVKEEVPGCVRQWMCLPEAGMGKVRFGALKGPLEFRERGWGEIWGLGNGMGKGEEVGVAVGEGEGEGKEDREGKSGKTGTSAARGKSTAAATATKTSKRSAGKSAAKSSRKGAHLEEKSAKAKARTKRTGA